MYTVRNKKLLLKCPGLGVGGRGARVARGGGGGGGTCIESPVYLGKTAL